MKKILTSKDEFVGRKMDKIIKLDDYYNPFKLYMFDDAVLIEEYCGYHEGSHILSENEILKKAVNSNINLDKISFEYNDECSVSLKPHTIYNIKSTKMEITMFGEDLISHGIATKEELTQYGNKKITHEVESIKVKRQRDIDECLAILAKYGINL